MNASDNRKRSIVSYALLILSLTVLVLTHAVVHWSTSDYGDAGRPLRSSTAQEQWSIAAGRQLMDNTQQCIDTSIDVYDRLPEMRTVFQVPAFLLYVSRSTRVRAERFMNRIFRVEKYTADLRSTQFLYTGSWTNWDDRRTMAGGMLDIAFLRNLLTDTAVHETTSAEQLKRGSCSEASKYARTADGTCNDRDMPLMGAADTRFGRNVPIESTFPDDDNFMIPNPRTVSNELLARPEDDNTATTASFLNVLVGAWIQFMSHDWFAHSTDDMSLGNFFTVPLPDTDRLRTRTGGGVDHLTVLKTSADRTREAADAARPPTYTNRVTHWWDGSQLYGSDQATQDRLRSGVDGKLTLSENNTLLPERNGQSDAGFTENWWVGLEVLHTLFALEHNAICDAIRTAHPSWDDEKLFQMARLTNAAVMAKIHTVEWTPAAAPNPILEAGLMLNWEGANTMLTTPIPKILQITKDFESFFSGLRGIPRDLQGHPYALTEEFVSIYRMHQLLPEELNVITSASGEIPVPMGETRNGQARSLAQEHGVGNLLHSMGTQRGTAMVLHNYPNFLRDIESPHGVIDLATTDILRDRERGVPRYNEFRRLVALKPIDTFVDLTGGDEALAQEIANVYDGDMEMVDLQVGMMAENNRPNCMGFGETAFQLFIIVASYRLQKDRFYTDEYRAEIYSQEGLDWVDASNMKTVMLRHFPELYGTDLASHGNPFAPW